MKRYSNRPFPPYRHLPGTTPHPERSPEGHMYGMVEPPATPLSREGPAENVDFLFGVDLFNEGFYWEAHTRWERLWTVEVGSPEIRRFLQGLIQMSAACLKAIQGRKEGARKLLERAGLETFGDPLLGIDARALAHATASFVEGEGGPPRIEIEAT